MNCRKYFIIPLSFFLFQSVRSQVVVNFSPSIYGQSLDGLVYAQIINSTTAELKVVETITIKQMTGGYVATIKTSSFVLMPGSNFISKSAFTSGQFNFTNTYYGNALSQSGRLPEGEYEYCFQTEITGAKPDQVPPVFENCFDFQLQSMTPLLLIDPIDGDKTCNKRPGFLWQLPSPLPLDAKCRLVLTEINDKQDIAEAIAFNPPILNQANLFGNQLLYPASAPDLKEEHKYAWQVTVYSGQTILKKSEIWTFTEHCEDIQNSSGNGYRELKEAVDGNYYIANKTLRFSFINPYSKGKLDYSIESISGVKTEIKKLPVLKMDPGLNKYEVDLSENSSFKNDEEYLLTVRLVNNRELKLKFIYKNE